MTRFLLIYFGLLLIAIPIGLWIQGRKKNPSSYINSNNNKLIQKSLIKLPTKEKLLELEKSQKREYFQIEFDSLHGKWKFVSVWKSDSDKDFSLFSSFLKVFSAELEIKKNSSIDNSSPISINTSIKFGLLSIEFCGFGYFDEKQALLIFFFNLAQLRTGSLILLRSALREPEENTKPYFKIIGLEKHKWFSARVQSDGLMLCIKD